MGPIIPPEQDSLLRRGGVDGSGYENRPQPKVEYIDMASKPQSKRPLQPDLYRLDEPEKKRGKK